ncbi:GNAT family N-acetyltransferase [Actinomadura rubrisoli]|uniref:GNAT family N-acetyltransferase n=1 Tax=Actinomadura rubrisoli TaxID=2530368 RepID=A0A4R5ADL3_9ACTN|nr:GNAT family N-acetyltransferase [Actinomadura rubrisoli]TDD69199.1 GNAT family N-acetyltransferase [Actinomadura rubrisoli]
MTNVFTSTDLAAIAAPFGGTVQDVTVDAVRAADAAARKAGVRVRTIGDLAGLDAVRLQFEGIWRPAGGRAPMTRELLRAMAKAGGYVSGAFEDGELVGACVGFFGPPPDEALHSHIAGVAARMRGRGVGFALKAHQRAWALMHGATEVSWTFDPLVRRNAYFAIGKLAAAPAEYLRDFYGRMDDAINGTDATDRLLVRWRLDGAEVAEACHGRHRVGDALAARTGGAVVALGATAGGGPAPGRIDGPAILVTVPDDIERLRRADPARAAGWRAAVREAFGELLADGWTVTGFDRAGWYIFGRKDES